MQTEQKTVIVLGMHRSGTSMTAGILKELGVSMGDRLYPASEWNPKGHYEDLDFLQLNNRILKAAGGHYLRPPARADVRERGLAFQEQIGSTIRAKQAPLWGWKEPRTCLTIELYLPYLNNPYFIVCHRDARAVAASLKRRDGLTIGYGLRLAREYTARIEAFFRENPGLRRLDLDYQEALDDPEAFVRRIADFLGLAVDEARFRNAVAMVLPRRRLAEISGEFRQKSVFRRIYRETMKVLRKIRHL